ncbi:MAG TPA: hypothetical protein VGK87_16875 [Anaerolineae bacterium]
MMSAVRKTLFGVAMSWISELRARGHQYDDLKFRMAASGQRIGARFHAAAPTENNIEAITHMTGIERWAAHRLRTAMGEPLVIDDYDGYRPAKGIAQGPLCDAFDASRAATLQLVDELSAARVPITAKVIHNELGAISVGAWLVYMNDHIEREGNLRVR